MAPNTVTAVSLDKNGIAQTGEGDTLIGTVEEHVKDIASRLEVIGLEAVEAVKRAEEIVASHFVKTAEDASADAADAATAVQDATKAPTAAPAPAKAPAAPADTSGE